MPEGGQPENRKPRPNRISGSFQERHQVACMLPSGGTRAHIHTTKGSSHRMPSEYLAEPARDTEPHPGRRSAPRRAEARPSWTSPTTNDQNPTADRADTGRPCRMPKHPDSCRITPRPKALKSPKPTKHLRNLHWYSRPKQKTQHRNHQLEQGTPSGPNLQIDPSHRAPPPGTRNWSSSQAWNLFETYFPTSQFAMDSSLSCQH